MTWIIETSFNHHKNMWSSNLKYSNDGVNYRHYVTRLHPDKQPTDEILEYFEKKKKEYAQWLEQMK